MSTQTPTKPPIGIIPEYMWKERRMWDLISTISCYHEARQKIPGEWMLELKQRVDEFVSSPVPSVYFDPDGGTGPRNVRCGLEK